MNGMDPNQPRVSSFFHLKNIYRYQVLAYLKFVLDGSIYRRNSGAGKHICTRYNVLHVVFLFLCSNLIYFCQLIPIYTQTILILIRLTLFCERSGEKVNTVTVHQKTYICNHKTFSTDCNCKTFFGNLHNIKVVEWKFQMMQIF